MQKLHELTVTKNKRGWTAVDRNGRSANGATRKMAINNWNLLYNMQDIHEYGYDMSKIEKEIP